MARINAVGASCDAHRLGATGPHRGARRPNQKAARIEVVNEGGYGAGDDLPDLASAARNCDRMGSEIGAAGPSSAAIYFDDMAPDARGLERRRRLTRPRRSTTSPDESATGSAWCALS